MSPRPARRWPRTRTLALLLVIPLVAIGVVAVVSRPHDTKPPTGPPCLATVGNETYGLELDQARNATTIAAVGRRDGLPDHAVTIALATALQESKLRNLDYGDLDSLGLFQQRPSQGWGTAQQVADPVYAASTFYRHLSQVKGWQTMDVTRAAQAVQHSAAPEAYGKWEPQARVLAQVLTGEVPAGFTCRITIPKGAQPDPQLQSTMTTELGSLDSSASSSTAAGWTAAAWLVGHAEEHNINTVSYAGQRWTAKTGTWSPAASGSATSGPPETS